ncbi:MAG: CpaF family protein [Eubacterium sp.]
MGLLDRYGNAGEEEKNVKYSANTDRFKPKESKFIVDDPFAEVKTRIHNAIIEQQLNENIQVTDENMRNLIQEFVEKPEYNIPRIDRGVITEELFDDIMGYGPIQSLVDSDAYSEIMVNGPYQIYVESRGKLYLTDIQFKDTAHLMQIIDRIVTKVGRHVDEASPMVDARLPDGSRVNVIIPPVSLVGPILTIRKFGKTPITAENLISWGSCNTKMLNFLEAAVKGKLNIIVSGGTGSGKTTLLNVLSSYIP